MDKMLVQGGTPLKGQVRVSGSKNSALPLIFSSLLAPGRHIFTNVPQLRDIHSALELMGSLGCHTHFEGHRLTIEVGEQVKTLAPYDQVRKMRASILVLGPLLARFKEAKVSLPGGCAIGARPIGLHLEGLEKMGAQISMDGGYVVAQTTGLKGAHISLAFPTVGGTENLMMAAALTEGTTLIENAAQEPEILDLGNYLETMGAQVEGAGTSTVKITGSSGLKAGEHRVIPDRIETGTLVIAGAITRGEVEILDGRPDHLESFLEKVQEMGVKLSWKGDRIRVEGGGPLKPTQVVTGPYPEYPTDLQAQIMALMTQAQGESQIVEKVFENRFMHVSELMRLGASIEIDGKTARIKGQGKPLMGAPLMATDLRASASLILAGLVARGETLVHRIYHLDRGYERLEDKLMALGARIKRLRG